MMKFYVILAILISSSIATAKTAILPSEVLQMIQAAPFEYKEHALQFGFVSIESCLYSRPDLVVLKNYCFPAKDYPARGYTIISLKIGVLRLYEEKLSGRIQRIIEISSFPEQLAPIFSGTIGNLNIDKLNHILEELHNLWQPGCWTTNSSSARGIPESKCYDDDVSKFQSWSDESMSFVLDAPMWRGYLDAISASLP